MSYDGEAGVAPVFVDPSGRRARLARALGLAVAAVCGLYLLLVGITLVAPPGVLPLSIPGLGRLLPGPGAPKLSDNLGRSVRPASVLTPAPSAGTPTPTPTPATARGPGSSSRPSASATPGSAVPTGRPTPTPTLVVTGRPTAVPSAAATGKPSPAARRTGKPTATPTPHSTRRP